MTTRTACKTAPLIAKLLRKSWWAMVATVVVTHGIHFTAQAAPLVTNAWGLSSNLMTCAANDALQLNATRGAAEGSLPLLGNQFLLRSDITYWYSNNSCFESATWTANGTGRKAAKLSSVFENPNATSLSDFYLPIDQFVKLRSLTIDNVDLDYDNATLWFTTSGAVSPAPDIPLTLNNGSITGVTPPAVFDSNARFNLTATGDSTIANWWTKVPVPSPTSLNVNGPGAKLTLFRVGNIHGQFGDALYFYGTGNTATIDNATLKLDQSAVTFGRPSLATG